MESPVDKKGRGGLAKCQRHYISLCSKLVNEGGGGQKLSKSCQRSLCMPPCSIMINKTSDLVDGLA